MATTSLKKYGATHRVEFGIGDLYEGHAVLCAPCADEAWRKGHARSSRPVPKEPCDWCRGVDQRDS